MVIAIVWSAGACTEFMEEPITNDSVELLSPGAHAETTTYSIQFLWEPLEYASHYRLQVASPTFRNAVLFYADTTVEKTNFDITLAPGKYQWRVKALNGSSETPYTTRSFTIHEAELSKQTVLLAGPPTYTVSADSPINLSWQGLFGAASYRLQVDTSGFAAESKNLVLDQVVEGLDYAFSPPDEANYQWRVRAERDTLHSGWSIVRNFIYDKTQPAAPKLATPADAAQVNRPVSLRWNKVADAANYLLYVYKSDSTLYDAKFPVRQTDTAYTFEVGERREHILWRVRAVDRAGNESTYSEWRSFVIRN